MKINIEAETAASIARTHAPAGGAAPPRRTAGAAASTSWSRRSSRSIKELHFALLALEDANLADNQDDSTPLK